MKKYLLCIVLSVMAFHSSSSFLLFHQRNNFQVRYTNTDPLYKAEIIDNLSFQYDIDVGGYTWQLQARGSEVGIQYQGKTEYEDDMKIEYKHTLLLPKIDPMIVKENEKKAICTLSENGDNDCTIQFTVLEVTCDMVLRTANEDNTQISDRVIDTTTIRAKDEANPISVSVSYTNDDFMSNIPFINIDSTLPRDSSLLNSRTAKDIIDVYTYEDERNEKKEVRICDSDIDRFQTPYYEFSNNVTGIYLIDDHAVKKIFDFNSLQESYEVLDVMNEHILLMKYERTGAVYFESYDMMGNRITKVPLEKKPYPSYYDAKNHLYIEQEYLEDDKRNLKLYQYQQNELVKIDEFNEVDATSIDMYHDGKIYQINLDADNQQLIVNVYDQKGTIFRGTIQSSVFESMDMYLSPLSNRKLNIWDQLMKPDLHSDSGGRLTDIEIKTK